MNIFILDTDKRKSVTYHPDKHIVKMPVEGTQLLCNAYYETGQDKYLSMIYKQMSNKHPCSIWASSSLDNWLWLKEYILLMGEEYTVRYGKLHGSVELIKRLPNPRIESKGLTPFIKCVPEHLRGINDIVEAYRTYFIIHKQHLRKYTQRQVPDWWFTLDEFMRINGIETMDELYQEF